MVRPGAALDRMRASRRARCMPQATASANSPGRDMVAAGGEEQEAARRHQRRRQPRQLGIALAAPPAGPAPVLAKAGGSATTMSKRSPPRAAHALQCSSASAAASPCAPPARAAVRAARSSAWALRSSSITRARRPAAPRRPKPPVWQKASSTVARRPGAPPSRFSRWSKNQPVFCPPSRSTGKPSPPSSPAPAPSGAVQQAHLLRQPLQAAHGGVVARHHHARAQQVPQRLQQHRRAAGPSRRCSPAPPAHRRSGRPPGRAAHPPRHGPGGRRARRAGVRAAPGAASRGAEPRRVDHGAPGRRQAARGDQAVRVEVPHAVPHAVIALQPHHAAGRQRARRRRSWRSRWKRPRDGRPSPAGRGRAAGAAKDGSDIWSLHGGAGTSGARPSGATARSSALLPTCNFLSLGESLRTDDAKSRSLRQNHLSVEQYRSEETSLD